MKAKIVLLPGDGIGVEVTAAARRVLEAIADQSGYRFEFDEHVVGGAAIDATGSPLPDSTVSACLDADAVFLGAVGGPKWSDPRAEVRPEQGLLGLRKALGVYANLRPVRVLPELKAASPLKAELLDGVDMIVVRELTGGIYFGDKHRDETSAIDVCRYETSEIERIVRMAAEIATGRRNRLCSVDKANVLETSRLWRETTDSVLDSSFPRLERETLLVDAAAMHLLSRPADFDVIVTENMFGDILTDEASMLAGSLGLLPSASLGESKRGLYEPVHGSAPDIAGRNIANPVGAIASAALLLRYSLGLDEESARIESAVELAIRSGARTADLARGNEQPLSTDAFTDCVLDNIA